MDTRINHGGSQQSHVILSLYNRDASGQAARPYSSLDNNAYKVVRDNGDMSTSESTDTKLMVVNKDFANCRQPAKQAVLCYYHVHVKMEASIELVLRLSPGARVMDVRQKLGRAKQTCYITCYDLILHRKDGSVLDLEDNDAIPDITSGNCRLEMVAVLYDDHSIRAHVRRMRELFSLPSSHSTLSALHKTGQKTSANSRDDMERQVPDLMKQGFLENAWGSLTSLLSSPSKEIECVDTLVLSTFNPPPSYRRLLGDLIYLDLVTLEGDKYCITGTTEAFYINCSTGDILDPGQRPNKAALKAKTLFQLIRKISPKFEKAFREILNRVASGNSVEYLQPRFRPNSWLGFPATDHERNASRAENSMTLSFGSESTGMRRCWNKELQSSREKPQSTSDERILRDKALYKVTSDFVDAATRGAIGVISRSIPPINPTDAEGFHMYVHNNIIFSFAVDGDLDQLPQKQSDVKSRQKCTKTEISSLDVSVDAQTAEREQATYASANNYLKGTNAFQEADVPGLYSLAMAIIDYRGHRVVAQSVVPRILQGDQSGSPLYGSVDRCKKIFWSENLHSKVLEAAKRLHLKEQSLIDTFGNVVELATPAECKGIIGSGSRHYLSDLVRGTPRDANYTGPGSRFCILRSELVHAFCHARVSDNSKSCRESGNQSDSLSNYNNVEEVTNTKEQAASAVNDSRDAADKGEKESLRARANKEIFFNPHVFTEFNLSGSQEEIAVDEENVRKASLYLKNIVLPKFIQDLCTLEIPPIDGQTLTEAFHAYGINMRYIGRVAEGTRHIPYLWDLCCNEIIARSSKHVVKDLLRQAEDHDLRQTILRFFNCFLDKGYCGSSKHKDSPRFKSQEKSSKVPSKLRKRRYSRITPQSLWSDIHEFAKLKYQFELPKDVGPSVKKISIVRNLCQKVGISIAARKYYFGEMLPFQFSDILDVQPVVKHSIPVCSEAKYHMDSGKVLLAEGNVLMAYAWFVRALAILERVFSPMHPEVANCHRYLALVLYQLNGNTDRGIPLQCKELIINERCLGLDHPYTAHSYENLALFYHRGNKTELALRYMSKTLLLLSLSCGRDHPHVASTLLKVAIMYKDVGKMDMAIGCLHKALELNKRSLGEEHIQIAHCYGVLAEVFTSQCVFNLALQAEKKRYNIFAKKFGENDSRTTDSRNLFKTYKLQQVKLLAGVDALMFYKWPVFKYWGK